MAEKPDIVGRAIYMEFRNKNGETQQLIVTPDGFATDGSYVPSIRVSRRISADKPKAPWGVRASAWKNAYSPGGQTITALPDKEVQSQMNERRAHVLPFLEQLAVADYKLFMDTIIAVDVTPQDMDDLRQHRTPWKILSRVTRSRRGRGMPDETYETGA